MDRTWPDISASIYADHITLLKIELLIEYLCIVGILHSSLTIFFSIEPMHFGYGKQWGKVASPFVFALWVP